MAEQPIIRIVNLEKKFPGRNGDIYALRDINLQIDKGDVFGIIGQSGAGKSTLVRCMNLLERPTQGSVFFDGTDLCKLPPAGLRKARRSMGMIFQQFNLLMQKTALENVCFPLELAGGGKKENRARAAELLEMVGLGQRVEAYPAQLSGGQKQRVAIARALATKPEVLLCDEATSALDPATTDSILALIRNINRELGITAVIITHEMSVIDRICNHVAIIARGVIIEEGSVEEVFFHPRTEAAKKLVLPEALQNLPGGEHYRLIFNGRSSFEPVIANMVLNCGCAVNILFADTRDINGVAFGQMILELPESPEARACILDYARTHSIILEKMEMLDEKTVLMLLIGTWDTIYMTVVATFFSYVFGIIMGVVLVITRKGGITPRPAIYACLDIVVNLTRSFPFLILMIAVIPFTRFLVGTTIGNNATIVPLVLAAAPFVARLVESSLLEVDHGVVEAAQSMGADTWQIISRVLVPEALPSLINGSAVSAITILGYSAMAGAVGGGGLGKLAIMYGYNRYQTDIMIITVVLLIIIVQAFQSLGNWATRKVDRR